MDSDERYDLLARLAPGGAEDFITGAFCWLLERTGFGTYFLGKLRDGRGFGGVPPVGSDCSWTTQESHVVDGRESRLDMVCNWTAGTTRKALIFEHKVDSPLGMDQIKHYRQVGAGRFGCGNYGIVLITRSEEQWDQCPDCRLLWRQVYAWVDDWLDHSHDSDEAFAARSFQYLLSKRGLGPMVQITTEQLRAIPVARVAEQRVIALAAGIGGDPVWRKLRDAMPRFPKETFTGDIARASKPGVEKRCGLYLLGTSDSGTWRPGVFVGVMLGADNHGPREIDRLGGPGPVACVALDVERRWHRVYPNSDPYARLVSAVRDRLACAADWAVHDTWSQSGARKRSGDSWHPLVIYKPLEAVIGALNSGEEQVRAFIEDIRPVVEAFVDLDELWKFKESLRD